MGVAIRQGDLYWADLPDPVGSGAGFRRPVVVVQGDAVNRSQIQTVVCVPLTTNLRWALAPGNVLLPAKETGLPNDSVANVSLLLALDRSLLAERVGHLPGQKVRQILSGLDVVLGRAEDGPGAATQPEWYARKRGHDVVLDGCGLGGLVAGGLPSRAAPWWP